MRTLRFVLPLLLLTACSSSKPAQGPRGSAPLPAPLAAAAERVKALLIQVDDAAVDQAFSPAFLKEVKRDALKDLFSTLGPQLGACGAPEALDIDSDTNGVVRFPCDHANVTAQIAAQPGAPYLMDALLVKAKAK